MTDLVANGYFENAGRTVAQMQAAMDQLQAFLAEQLGAQAEASLTIASDSITPAAGACRVVSVDTEASAVTDNLLSIVTTNVPDGGLIALRNANTARKVVVKHSASPAAGQIFLSNGGADITLEDRKTWLILKRTGTTWEEFWRYEPLLNTATVSTAATMTVDGSHKGKLIQVTAAATLNLTAVATLGKGFFFHVMADGGAVTIDGNGAETINGAATIVLADGDWAIVYVNAAGTAFLCKRPLMQGRQSIPIRAAGMRPRASNGCAALAALETATNKVNYQTLDFDGTTQEFAQFSTTMPKSWDEGPMQFIPVWTTGGGGTVAQGVVWGIQAIAFGDGDSLEAAWPAEVKSTDALLSTTAAIVHTGPMSGDFSANGTPQPNDDVYFQVSRMPGDAGDTMSGIDARLLGILLLVGINAGNDK